MARVRLVKARRGDRYKQGIHLLNPTRQEVENAKGDAYAKGFSTIWIHGRIRK